ncbi:hypothetical protein Q2490_16775 [Myroides odoratimimus]|uniref:hypothetical protein n=1 Tax=Myroides odoratimimus TaxID=76832 RepID=UPI0026E113CB|nr:hypothetical protein [Myroides odoratimimus]MDO5858932.1 hypothetical protein [Myroides odoratimimus]
MRNIEDDLTRLPAREEHFYITAEKEIALYLFAIMISKREIITKLSYFTNCITIAEYNALVELQQKCAIGHITVLTSVKPVFVSDSVNLEIKVASFSGELLLVTTPDNYYVFESSAMGKVEDTFHFLTIANDKRVLEFKESILTNNRLKYE